MEIFDLRRVNLLIRSDINSMRKERKTVSTEYQGVQWSFHGTIEKNDDGVDEVCLRVECKFLDDSLYHKFATGIRFEAGRNNVEYGEMFHMWNDDEPQTSATMKYDLRCFDDRYPIVFRVTFHETDWEACLKYPTFAYKDDKLSDFELMVGGERFYTSKHLILQHATEKFHEQIVFQEQLDSIADCDPKVFRKFLAVLLGYKVNTIGVNQFLKFADLSLKFGFEQCLKHCEASYCKGGDGGISDELKDALSKIKGSELWKYCNSLKKRSGDMCPTESTFETILEFKSRTRKIEEQIFVGGMPFHVSASCHTRSGKKYLKIDLKCLYISRSNQWKIGVTIDYNKKGKQAKVDKNRKKLHFCDDNTEESLTVPFTPELRIGKTGKGICQEQNSVNFNKHQRDLTDIVLSVNDKKFHANKQILANLSEYFYKMFYGDFAEKDKTEITLSGIDEHDFEEFLQHIYDPKRLVNESTIDGLLHCSQYFDVSMTRINCAYYIRYESKLDTIQKLTLCAKHSLNDLFNHFVSDIANPQWFIITEGFKKLDEEIQNMITTQLAARQQSTM